MKYEQKASEKQMKNTFVGRETDCTCAGKFTCPPSELWCPVVWSNVRLDAAKKVFHTWDDIYSPVTLSKRLFLLMWAGFIQPLIE